MTTLVIFFREHFQVIFLLLIACAAVVAAFNYYMSRILDKQLEEVSFESSDPTLY